MPTYDYQCDACDAVFEAFQSIHDDALKNCPYCQQAKLRRLISGAGIIFKGSGFYVNDSKKKNDRPPAASAGDTPKSSTAASN